MLNQQWLLEHQRQREQDERDWRERQAKKEHDWREEDTARDRKWMLLHTVVSFACAVITAVAIVWASDK